MESTYTYLTATTKGSDSERRKKMSSLTSDAVMELQIVLFLARSSILI